MSLFIKVKWKKYENGQSGNADTIYAQSKM